MAAMPIGERKSPSGTNGAADRDSTRTNAASSARPPTSSAITSYDDQPSGSARITPSTMASSPPVLSSAPLSLKCQYMAIGVTPCSWASRRMVTASSPSASASATAEAPITSGLRRVRVAAGCLAISSLYGVHVAGEVDHVRHTGFSM
jgi:hypothetical protein